MASNVFKQLYDHSLSTKELKRDCEYFYIHNNELKYVGFLLDIRIKVVHFPKDKSPIYDILLIFNKTQIIIDKNNNSFDFKGFFQTKRIDNELYIQDKKNRNYKLNQETHIVL
jgi:hypothetical protein